MDIVRLSQILQKDCDLDKDRPVLVGVSGGADSLCLVDALDSLGYAVIVAHFNHRMRPEAAEEARQVEALARERGWPFRLGEAADRGAAGYTGLSSEETARKARYRFLFEQARAAGVQAVSVGHTADDQVETVLMHLLRGSGLAGLHGMLPRVVLPGWDAGIPLVRPLLWTWHAETLAYCTERGLRPVFDPSNQNPRYFRNRLRHELIPFLQRYNPQIKTRLLYMAQALAGDEQVAAVATRQARDACLVEADPGILAFDLDGFKGLLPGLQRRLLRKAVDQLRPDLRDVDYETIERGRRFVEAPPGTQQSDWIANLWLSIEDNQLTIRDTKAKQVDERRPQLLRAGELILPVPGRVTLAGGWEIVAERVDCTGEQALQMAQAAGPQEAWLDSARLRWPLVARPRRPGDRLAPLGMQGGSVKLSDLMINLKIPQRLRQGWPLVCSGDRIAWVVGLRIAEVFSVAESTREVVRLRLMATT